MRTTIRKTALVLTLLITAGGWRIRNARLALQPESRLWIEGSSTIRDFTCNATLINALVDTRSANAIPQLLIGDKAVVAVDVKVPAEKIDCGNGTMNEHMLTALKAAQSPTILFRLSSYDIARSGETVTGTLKGTLSLGGAQKAVTLSAHGKPEGDLLRVTGAADVKMTDYDLTPPSLMFGRIRVADKVTVKFDLLLKS
jgi:hypothetical protein